MALNHVLIAFCVSMLFAGTIYNSAGLSFNGANTLTINNVPAGTTIVSCTDAEMGCLRTVATLPTNAFITCSSARQFGSCQLTPYGPSATPSETYATIEGCDGYVAGSSVIPVNPSPFNLPPFYCGCFSSLAGGNCALFLKGGLAIFSTTPPKWQLGSAAGTGAQTQAGIFSVSTDWTAILFGLITLAVVSAISVFVVGLNAEATHIIFLVGGLLALWTILSIAAGVALTGFASTSIWAVLDSFQINGVSAFLGTALYLIVSLIMFVSTLQGVSRGVV